VQDRPLLAPPAPPPPPPPAAAPAPDEAAPKPVSGRAAAKGAETAAPSAEPIERAPAARIAVVARITLIGAEATAPADTYLKLRIAPNVNRPRRTAPETLEIHQGPEPEFEIDVTDLFAGFVPGFELEVAADRAGFIPALARVRVSRLVSVAGKPAVVPVGVNLELAGEAAGVVQDDHNRPVALAAVGSYALVSGRLEPVDATATDQDGRFRLRLRPDEVHVIVASAKGLLPSAAQVRGVAGETADVTGLVLYEGHAIAGRASVSVRGGPPPGLRVLAFPSAGGEPFQLGDDFYVWRDGRVVRRPGTAVIESDGTYRVTGLVPEDHIVSLDCPQMLAEVADSTAVHAVAPREGVGLSLVAAWSVATVRGPQGPLPNATVSLRVVAESAEKYGSWKWDQSEPSAVGTTDAEGAAWFLAPEEVRYSITAEAEGHAADRRLATTPFNETIELRQLPDTSLVLALRAVEEADGTRPLPPRVEVRFYDAHDPKPFPSFVRRADVVGTTATVRGLVGGSYHVEVLARPQGWYLMASTDVKLAWNQPTDAAVKLARGGRVHVAIRGTSGVAMPGTYRVLDRAGIEHAAGSVSAVASESAEAPLVAGDYRVAVTPADGAEQIVPVAVEVAKTARVEVTSPPVR
jgi:hypothetical protein